MSYRTQALLADDYNAHQRIAACAAAEGIKDPLEWVQAHAWEFSALPGWGDAYDAAVLKGNIQPGSTSDVITDGMILSGVKYVMGTLPAA